MSAFADPPPPSISSVSLDDPDNTGFGLDGRDFHVTWTPVVAPAGFLAAQLYIVPAATGITVDNVNTACGGDMCAAYAIPGNPFLNTEFTLYQTTTADSTNTNFNQGTPYKACIFLNATVPELICSNGVSVVSDDSIADGGPPMINSPMYSSYLSGSTATIYAKIADDQTAPSEFNVDPTAKVQMFYDNTTEGTVNLDAPVAGTRVSNTDDIFQFQTTPMAPGRQIHYFLKAIDKAGKKRYFTTDPSLDNDSANKSDAQAAAAAFTLMPVSAGPNAISGFIEDSSGNPISGATVILGYAVANQTTAGDGSYTFTNVPAGFYDVSAEKDGYCGGRLEPMNVTSSRINVNVSLNSGKCFLNVGGSGPNGGDVFFMFSNPPNNSNFALINGPILAGFSQPLNANTVFDNDASNVDSKIYLTMDGSTKIAGAVTYCANSNSPGCGSLTTMDANVVVFTPTASLNSNTAYTLVVTNGVTSESGQSIKGGGTEVRFTTGSDAFSNWTSIGSNFGTGGNYMPPFVQSSSPTPGMEVASNSALTLTFNDPLKSDTITSSNFKLYNGGTQKNVTISSDSTDKIVFITPDDEMTEGEYTLKVYGAVANSINVPMRNQANAGEEAFVLNFRSSGIADSSVPEAYPMLPSGTTNLPINMGFIEVGFSEPMSPQTFSTSTVTLNRGSTSVAASVVYDSGKNSVFLIPDSVLLPSTIYTVSLSDDITDLSGNPIEDSTYTYTTETGLDSTSPKIRDTRCDDYRCTVFFTEPMNNDAVTGENHSTSVLNLGLWQIQRTLPDVSILDISGKPINYDPIQFSITIEGVAGLASGDTFQITATGVTDLSGNVVADSAKTFTGRVENSANTSGSFGGGGMYAPPVSGSGAGAGLGVNSVGGKFTPEGFGSWTGEQFAFGQIDKAFPFNSMAGQDSNVFQTKFISGISLEDEDQVILTFPNGTTVTNVGPDTQSPYYADFDESGDSTIGFDTSFGGDGIVADNTARTVTVQLNVTGTPSDDTPITIDLKKVVNPTIPKGRESGGYTVGIKVKRGDEVILNKTSIPYFINQGGSNTINVSVYAVLAGGNTPVSGANGDVYVFGGGPGGPMDKKLTLTDGGISAVDGSAGTFISYTNLPDGCYNLGTEPMVSLGDNDYFGQDRPDQVCVSGGGDPVTKTINLTKSVDENTVPITVKFEGIDNFEGVDMEIFGGGPGRFVKKTLSDVGVPNAEGYLLKLNANGQWFIGIGPAMSMSKGSAKTPEQLPIMPPPPVNLNVTGIGGSVSVTSGTMQLPPGVEFDSGTKTLTYTFNGTADKTISGTVTDGTNLLPDVEVRLDSQGFGSSMFVKTKSDGVFTFNVSNYGSYRLCASKSGLSERCEPIEYVNEGNSDKIYFRGKSVGEGNPFILKLKKPSYYISGKILDSSSNGIGYAPVFAQNTTGDFVNGGSSSDGSYTLYVDAGTWTVKSHLPPDKTDFCGTFSKEVVVTDGNKTSQNVTPSAGTCSKLSGTITVNGSVLQNVPVSIESWDSVADMPNGDLFRPTGTNSSGYFEAKVAKNKTYKIRVWTPDYGELSTTATVATSDLPNQDITVTTGDITFTFTGGTEDMKGFIQLKRADDGLTKFGKPVDNLSSNIVMPVKTGSYYYFINLFGIGDYQGTISTGETEIIDVSQNIPVELTGNVKDSDGNNLSKVLITAMNVTGNTRSSTTDADGNYSVKIKPGTYTIKAALAGYLLDQRPVSTAIAEATVYDFGPETENGSMTRAPYVISGTIYKSDGSTPVSNGSVEARSSSGGLTVASVSPQDGSYSIPVSSGTWTLKARSSFHAATTKTGSVTVGNADVPAQNITLTADSTKTPSTTSQILSASQGGSVSSERVSVTAGAGVFGSSDDVTVEVTKNYTAPTTESYAPLADAIMGLSATGLSRTISNFNGNVGITVNYCDSVDALPDSVDESDLKLVYFDTEKNEYVEVEGGYTVDTDNCTVTGEVSHFTDFALVYASDGGAPGTPTGLSATAASSSQINLSWTATDEATSYDIYRSTSSGGTFARLGSEPTVSSGSTTTYSDTALSASTAYYYKISALNDSGESAASSEVSATTTGGGGVVIGGGGGGGGGGGDSKPKVETNSLTGLKVVKEAYAVTAGTITEAVTVSTANNEVAVSLAKDLKITDADGKPFAGQITPPQVVQVTTAAPENKTILGNVYEIGIKDKGITFDKPVTLRFALPVGTKSTDKISTYYLDEKTNTWTIAGDGGKIMSDGNGKFVLVVEVTHFTKFASMQETKKEAAKINFKDIATHWAKTYIEDISSRGIINGYPDGNYKPDNNISRAELVKIAVKMFGLKVADKITENPFKDVPASEWYGPYIKVALDSKIVKGYDEGTFRPNHNVTRVEALKILLEAAKVTLPTNVKSPFTDVINSGWYAPYVEFAVSNGLANGYSKEKFEPARFITRAEVAKISSLMIAKGLLSKTVSMIKDILGV